MEDIAPWYLEVYREEDVTEEHGYRLAEAMRRVDTLQKRADVDSVILCRCFEAHDGDFRVGGRA